MKPFFTGIWTANGAEPDAQDGLCGIDAEALRHEIDAILREDARRFPAFATARRAAVLADVEAGGPCSKSVQSTHTLLQLCREYEDKRGGGRVPRQTLVGHDAAIRVYERARGCR